MTASNNLIPSARKIETMEYAASQAACRDQAKKARSLNDSPSAELSRLIRYLKLAGDKEFTGFIKINFSRGSIGRIEKFEEILRK